MMIAVVAIAAEYALNVIIKCTMHFIKCNHVSFSAIYQCNFNTLCSEEITCGIVPTVDSLFI